MTYEVIILGHLHMPLYFIGTFTEYSKIAHGGRGCWFIPCLLCYARLLPIGQPGSDRLSLLLFFLFMKRKNLPGSPSP